MVYIDSVTIATSAKPNASKATKNNSKFFSEYKVKEKKTTKASTNKSQKLDAASMMMLQEALSEDDAKQEMQQFGRQSLEVLRKLQLQLLNGKPDIESLTQMQMLLDNSPTPHSPPLKKLANALKTRIAVEIAKIQ